MGFAKISILAPPKQFELAFKMFDDNGDGNLDPEEYEKVGMAISLYCM